jgi:aspartyl aminopeptidase
MAVRDLIDFLNASPTPYHAASETVRRLDKAGFAPVDLRAAWSLAPGTRAYLVHGGATVIAFVLGQRPPAEAGFVILGAHTDSPNLRVKPTPDVRAHGYAELAVEVYGGMIYSTWLDRDLSIAGRVVLGGGVTRLVDLKRPLFRIPSLAIHLDRDVNKSLVLNAQTHLLPLSGREADGRGIRELVGHALDVGPRDVAGYDLCLYDTQPAALAGYGDELVVGSRLDDLAGAHAALSALFGSGEPGEATRVVALFDHEEIGSQSASGARSSLLSGVLERLAMDRSADSPGRALSRSMFVSVDMAHAVHPNYADKHDPQHKPVIGHGPVLKSNVGQSYATDAPMQAMFAEACRAAGVTAQHFVSRNDQPCGSTIGPIGAARLGIRTVDVGNPMLAMHSCRETAGAADVGPMIAALTHVLTSETPVGPSV